MRWLVALQVVRAAALSQAPAKDARLSGFRSLQRELEALGASFTGCAIDIVDGTPERTVRTTTAIAAGAVMMRIPVSLGVTPQRATETESGAAAAAHGDVLGTSDADLLALWLLEHEHSSLYVATLPAQADLAHLPVFWDGEDLAGFRGSDVERAFERRVGGDATFYEALRLLSPRFSEICADEARWTWAKALVMSRAFTIPDPQGATVPPTGLCLGEAGAVGPDDDDDAFTVFALFPLADMLNHVERKDGALCEWGVERDGSGAAGDFVVRALHELAAGTELSQSYGALSTGQALLNYGFVYDAPDGDDAGPAGAPDFDDEDEYDYDDEAPVGVSANDRVTVKISLDRICAVFPETKRTDALEELWLRDEFYYADTWAPNERRVDVGVGDAASGMSLLSLCRVAVCSATELEALLDDSAGSCAADIATGPVSLRNERAALGVLDLLVTADLARRPTSLEFDEGVAKVAPPNRANAARASIAEKQILVHWQTLARRGVTALDGAANAGGAAAFDAGLVYANFLKVMLESGAYFGRF
ncbi:hypothetical protein M885DRAFT_530205 [Pelagophyceae sp. CCMP2097]|nr:hypothetical protein M885DRAFT_530205 [Pelagophyceae sp. CCMP2097]